LDERKIPNYLREKRKNFGENLLVVWERSWFVLPRRKKTHKAKLPTIGNKTIKGN